MCGRFVQSGSADDYARYFGADIVKAESLAGNYNVAPTDHVYAVAEHDGDLSFESEPGKGSLFRIILPLAV